MKEEIYVQEDGKLVVISEPTEENITLKDEEIEKTLGVIQNVNKMIFNTISEGREYYQNQLNNCENGKKFFEDTIKKLEEEVVDAKIFEKIGELKGKLDISKHKGKYKLLEDYLKSFTQYNQAKNMVSIRETDSKRFRDIIDKIDSLEPQRSLAN